MSMVEDLIKSLQICGRTGESCDGCMFSETDPDECGYRLNAAAAAALENAEELNKWLNESNNKLHGCLMSARTKLAEFCGTQGWISVEDRLPENDDHVLCCTLTKAGRQNIVIGYYMDGLWRCGMNSNVTHWMPMPEPPEVEA